MLHLNVNEGRYIYRFLEDYLNYYYLYHFSESLLFIVKKTIKRIIPTNNKRFPTINIILNSEHLHLFSWITSSSTFIFNNRKEIKYIYIWKMNNVYVFYMFLLITIYF